MGELINAPDDLQTGTAVQYSPTALEALAVEHIKKCFEASSASWSEKHTLQKRLWSRYLNEALETKDISYTSAQLGRMWYICDVVHSIIGESLLTERPYGKIVGEGNEDFAGAQAINDVNKWQQGQKYIKIAHSDSLLHSIVTGTGIKILGWEYYNRPYLDKIDKLMQLPNPMNPAEPIEIPTGEKELTVKNKIIDQIACMNIPAWRTFPPVGGTSPLRDPYLMFLMPFNKHQLKELESTGFIKNVDFIDPASYGTKPDDPDVSDFYIEMAKKEGDSARANKNICWLIFYFGLHKYSDDGSVPDEKAKEESCFIIKTKYGDTCLKFNRNPYPGIPVTRDKYSGTDDEWYGRSFTEIIEKMVKLDEDMFGYVQDAAKREVFRRTFKPASMDDGQLARWGPDQLISVPDALFQQGKLPITDNLQPQAMPNMQEQRRINTEIIDEISGVLDFVRGGDIDEAEKATMTTARVNFLSKRFKNRMVYYEDHGLHEWLEWQVILNHMFLPDETVEKISGYPAWLNPFKLIEPVLPMQTFDFSFEGATKAADNPVQAQIYKSMIDVAAGIGPGIDEQGRMVQPNLMALFRQFVKKMAPDEDIDEFFMPVMGEMMGLAGTGQGNLGAVTPGDMMGNSGMPSNSAGIRQAV